MMNIYAIPKWVAFVQCLTITAAVVLNVAQWLGEDVLQAAHHLCTEWAQLDIAEANYSWKTLKTLLKSCRLTRDQCILWTLIWTWHYAWVSVFLYLQNWQKMQCECTGHVKAIDTKQMHKTWFLTCNSIKQLS